MRQSQRPIEEVAEEIRRLQDAMSVGPGRPWRPDVWPRARRRLNRRCDALLLEAALMLGVRVPPRAEWGEPDVPGGLFGDAAGDQIERSLRAVGFDPWEIGEPKDA